MDGAGLEFHVYLLSIPVFPVSAEAGPSTDGVLMVILFLGSPHGVGDSSTRLGVHKYLGCDYDFFGSFCFKF
ncbi:hypothetical protein BDY19DRAFT_438413 [Irpex rosettiformis]|uniref:Uncharacterized protein n=1 Tax=Irpex rosettiformis TaxID=378272 RepID=A0ACB8TU50_9APHY|nr:hypothetical protein BDY19DRAFT_438413 [Irpex rosettiformis]